MRLLLDTHTWLWMEIDTKRLGKNAKSLLEDRSNELFLSMVSVWEMVQKRDLGKLKLPMDVQNYVRSRQRDSALGILDITREHIFALERLELRHRDPFDRMLICQAQIESLALLTADQRLFQYPASTIDARR